MKATDKLLGIGGNALVEAGVIAPAGASSWGGVADELLAMLRRRNGFYAFESALHVLPAAEPSAVMTLGQWNSPLLWRDEYGDLAAGKLFFAEDVFGDQFCLHAGEVCSFDAETGQLEVLATSIEDWAALILRDYEVITGYPLAHEWQVNHGRLPAGARLVPVTPFVLGGEYSLENLRVTGAVSAMRFRGHLAQQLLDVPEGAQIELD